MKIILPGVPVAQTRMKYSGRGGFGRIYDPRAKEKNEIKKQVTEIVKKIEGFKLLEHPRVSFIFHMPIPKGISKKEQALYHSGVLKYEKKPDVDNFIKLYLDCIDSIVFDGDQKVQLGPSIRLYHPDPKTIIILNETEELLSPLEVDPMTWYALFSKESGRCCYAEMVSLPDSYTPTKLIPSLCCGNSYPRQTIGTCEVMPTALQIVSSSGFRLNEVQSRTVHAC